MRKRTSETTVSLHQMIRRGSKAFCACGAWACRTNEVVEEAVRETLQKQYGLHLQQSAPQLK
jgi:hypothetical protein